MTRKSKQPGGHNPLTYHEQKRLKSSGYGTQSHRLSTESQLPFGSCCLGLSPAVDPVATPSGHVYSREAIVQYLLSKNGELKRRRVEYDAQCTALAKRHVEKEERKKGGEIEMFVKKDQGAMQQMGAKTSSGRADDDGKMALKKSSFWLASSQPQYRDMSKVGTAAGFAAGGDESDVDEDKEWEALPPPPSDRPQSPMSGQPLKLKQLIPLHLLRENDGCGKMGGNNCRVLCAVSGKAITTQCAVVITKSGQVMLRSVYDELAKPTMTCPVSGAKFKEKNVVELQKAASGFAASGSVVATKYRPTLT